MREAYCQRLAPESRAAKVIAKITIPQPTENKAVEETETAAANKLEDIKAVYNITGTRYKE